jgi:hypothetical protein
VCAITRCLVRRPAHELDVIVLRLDCPQWEELREKAASLPPVRNFFSFSLVTTSASCYTILVVTGKNKHVSQTVTRKQNLAFIDAANYARIDFLTTACASAPAIAEALEEAMVALRRKQRLSCREWCECADCQRVTDYFGEEWYAPGETEE